jgi:hypothetical protein
VISLQWLVTAKAVDTWDFQKNIFIDVNDERPQDVILKFEFSAL